MTYSVVIPTLGRSSLAALLASLDAAHGPRPERIVLVDDRRDATQALPRSSGWTAERTVVVQSGGRGPAAARNCGWRSTPSVEWVVFLDDDVVVTATWLTDLAADLRDAGPDVAGSQARLTVPLPADRRPTDAERGTAGLAGARWITADMAYRRRVLVEVGGFDERFGRAFREDADIALRITERPYRITSGVRNSEHPVRPARWTASVTSQRGNADDALMRRLHGPAWEVRAGAARGRRPAHLATTSVALLWCAGRLTRRRRLSLPAGLAYTGLVTQFAWARIAPGPRTSREIASMLVTSAAIPPAATWHWLRGTWRHRKSTRQRLPLRAVLVDRDGTLVRDVPYNGDPAKVEALPGVRTALRRLRAADLKVGVISNQSGVARGVLTLEQVEAVNARVDQLLGPFDDWQICPHAPESACACRKPEPGMIHAAAAALGVAPEQCAVIGDIGTDVEAAHAAGAAFAVLVPTGVTRQEEVDAAAIVCGNIEDAAALILARVSA